jgi:hypothetical protein
MNKEQQELLDEAYKNYWSNAKNNNLDCLFKQEEGSFLVEMRFYYKEEFINKCKTNPEFSERWGLKIEERELSVIERIVIAENSTEIIPGFDSHFDTDEDVHKVLDTWNTPTKLITITYNDKTIESYE